MESSGCLTGRVSPANGDLGPLGSGDPVALSVSRGTCEYTGGKISSGRGAVNDCSTDGGDVAQYDRRCMGRTAVGDNVMDDESA